MVGVKSNDIKHLTDQLPPPFLLIGDFNAKNPILVESLTEQQRKDRRRFAYSERHLVSPYFTSPFKEASMVEGG